MKVKLMNRFCPKIKININALNKMKEYIHQSNLEIGWLGTVTKDKNIYTIEDVFLFKQEVSSVTTEITTEGLNEFAMELLQKPEGIEIWNNMKMWGHSHVNMSTAPSGQDDEQIEVFSNNADDFFIRIIANKRNEFKIDLYDYTTGVVYEDLEYELHYGKDEEEIQRLYWQIELIKDNIKSIINPSVALKNNIKSEIEEKVSEKIYTNYNTKNSYQKYYDDFNYDYNGFKNNNKKKETSQRGEKMAIKIFDELEEEEIFELMYFIESGLGIEEYLNEQLTYDEQHELEALIEDYCETNKQKFYKYIDNVMF